MRALAVVPLVALTLLSPFAANADTPNPWLAPAKVRATMTACLAKNPQEDSSVKVSQDCTSSYVERCDRADHETTVAMVSCGDAVAQYWTGVVDARTKALLAKHDPAITRFVRSSEPPWRSYLKSRCAMYALFQGTMWGPVSVSCALEVTMQRAGDLDDFARNYPAAGNP